MELNQILVVDDEPDLEHLLLQKFRKKIIAKEYSFIFAKDGVEAFDIIKNNNSLDLILTDINMPGMDGLSLISRVKELNNRSIRFIIVSAYGDMENIRSAMNRGAYDFITKPIDLNDLEITIEKTFQEIQKSKVAFLHHEKLISLKRELDIATAIQTSILPKKFPAFPSRNDFDIYAKMIPAREVGGDFYDFFLLDDYRVGIVIGDATGKGIASALLMAISKTLLKAIALKGTPTDYVLEEMNNMLAEEIPSDMFITIFYGILDTRTGSFEYTNAGHCHPYLLTADGKICQFEKVGGLLIGAVKDAHYESDIITLHPDDSLFFYTDGVTEAFNIKEEEFNEQRLFETLQHNHRTNCESIIDNVISNVRVFTESIEQSDDITCMALRYLKS